MITLTAMKQTFHGVKEGIKGFVVKNVVAGSVAMAVLPLPTLISRIDTPDQPQPWQTNLVLAESQPELLEPVDQDIKIEVAKSRYQEEQDRLAAEQRKRTQVATAKAVAVADVSQEQKIALAQKAANSYGIPPELLVAVWKVESGMRWYYCGGSSAGAQGPAQFMPGTFRKYGVDGNGDGRKDICHAEDAIPAAANLLAANGANRGDYRRALFAYNHADWYVNKVLNLAGM